MLPYDVSRCKGEAGIIQCAKRKSCARYLQLDVRGPMTPVTEMMSVYWVRAECVQVANECDFFIEVTD